MRIPRLLMVASFIVMVAVNALAAATPVIGGRLTSEVSDKYPTLITPAGYVFSIWSIIYLLLGIFVAYHVLPGMGRWEVVDKIWHLFVLNCLLNASWILLWNYEQVVYSVILMFLILTSLIAIYKRLEIGRVPVDLRVKFITHLPFSVYLGWISVATAANVAATLVSLGWDGFGLPQEIWALVVISAIALITLLVVSTKRDIAFGLVVVWALLGIANKRSDIQTIVLATWAASAVILLALTIALLYHRVKAKT